ncbi:electron transfer flavoprotein subunit alpha/FixB family protein [Marinitenerispora sediminis]|nr:electron transfer flavoprotein subunit alpha/FixB family protein [Marinitenerispora sediminis]RCV62340.1 electron transfer flavoprotein subunit alpha/FixB family protein [Marinitenerispora sediminis]
MAVVPVRDATLPPGGAEAVAEAGGVALLAGGGAEDAAAELRGSARLLLVWESPEFQPGRWARAVAGACAAADLVLLPACPDGRDLAPRLAARLGRPLLAGAVRVGPGYAVLPRDGDRRAVRVGITGPAVVTLRPGVGGAAPVRPEARCSVRRIGPAGAARDPGEARVVAVRVPEPGAADLSEAERVVVGGAGLLGGPDGGAAAFAALSEVARALGAAVGGTRAAAEAGLVAPERRVGATGVRVSPELHIAVGVSGAPRYLAGTGDPAHVVAVDRDPGSPMMAAADLGLVTDAPGLLAALARMLRDEAAPGTAADAVGDG